MDHMVDTMVNIYIYISIGIVCLISFNMVNITIDTMVDG